MSHLLRGGCAALALALLAVQTLGHDQVPGAPAAGPILLRGGDLYTVSHGVLSGYDLLVEDGEIAAIGPNLPVPPGTEVVDVSGKRVYPGLVAALSLLGIREIEAVEEAEDRDELGSVTPEVATHVAFNPDSEVIPTVRNHGVTTVQVIPAGDLVAGRSFLTHLDGWTKEQSGLALVDGLVVYWPLPADPADEDEVGVELEDERDLAERPALRRLRQAFDDAEAYRRARGADAQVPVDLRWEAMAPVLAAQQPLYVVADDYRQIVEAISFALDRRLRLVLAGGYDAYRVADLLRQHDIPVIYGRSPSSHGGGTQRLPLRPSDPYDLPFRIPLLLHEAGVRFCITREGFYEQRDLPFQAGQAVAYGLPPEVALRSVTLAAAEILGLADRQGSLEVGKDATLFVSAGDVLDVLGQRVELMLIQGRPVDLDDKQKELWRKYRQRPAGGRWDLPWPRPSTP